MPAPNFLTAPPCNLGAEIPCIIGGKPYPWPTPALEFLHTLARVRVRAYWLVLFAVPVRDPLPGLLGVTQFTPSRACAYLSRGPDNAAVL